MSTLSAKKVEKLMPEILEGFREVLKSNGLTGVDVSTVSFQKTALMETSLAANDCNWTLVCKETPTGLKCGWECI